MNKSFYNQENIDAYLTNKLSGEEKKMFEDGLSKDPLIQNEVSLQKEIIESLKETRRVELKSRLNKIDVGNAVNNSYKYKIAASVLIILGLLSGSYFLFKEKEAPAVSIVKTSPIKSISPKDLSTQSTIAVPAETSANSLPEKADNYSEKINQGFGKSKPADAVIHDHPELVASEYAEVKSPQIKDSFGDEDIKTEGNITIPEGNVISNEDTYKSDVELSIQPSGENSFHYQYYSNKLYLYCDFKSKPYELLEWNTKKTKQLYLYFNKTYYELKHNQTEIAPLKSINDKQLIKQLDNIKDK